MATAGQLKTQEEREARRSFLRTLVSRAPLPPHSTAAEVATFVTCTVAERLTRGGAHTMLGGLPAPIASLFERCIDEAVGPASTLDRSDLLQRTADRLGITPASAERICAAVLSTLRDWLPKAIADDVAAQLPKDLKELWYSTPEASAETLPEWETETAHAQLFAEIEREGILPPEVDVADAFMAVMCIFSQRLSGGEARHVLLGLPNTLRPLVTTCMRHREEWADVFGRDELLRRVAHHLGTDEVTAERVVRAVFSAVKRTIPYKEVEDSASQLPPDLRDLWLTS
ncbi:MAG TPA: DUF2267 domain-containing protein [Labilithrix sp.]|nr:DUF2267 domain-containing protein [Labilithrix sp.]